MNVHRSLSPLRAAIVIVVAIVLQCRFLRTEAGPA